MTLTVINGDQPLPPRTKARRSVPPVAELTPRRTAVPVLPEAAEPLGYMVLQAVQSGGYAPNWDGEVHDLAEAAAELEEAQDRHPQGGWFLAEFRAVDPSGGVA